MVPVSRSVKMILQNGINVPVYYINILFLSEDPKVYRIKCM